MVVSRYRELGVALAYHAMARGLPRRSIGLMASACLGSGFGLGSGLGVGLEVGLGGRVEVGLGLGLGRMASACCRLRPSSASRSLPRAIPASASDGTMPATPRMEASAESPPAACSTRLYAAAAVAHWPSFRRRLAAERAVDTLVRGRGRIKVRVRVGVGVGVGVGLRVSDRVRA